MAATPEGLLKIKNALLKEFVNSLIKGASSEVALKTLKEKWSKAKLSPPPLHYAAQIGALGVLAKLLAAGAPVDETVPKVGLTPLAYAAHKNQIEAMKLLLERGANPNSKNARVSPLFSAIKGNKREAVNLLIRSKADVKQLIGDQTFLMAAFSLDSPPDPSVLEALIKAGLDINATDNEGNTTLMQAVMISDVDAVKFLLEQQANPHIPNNLGDNCFAVAREKGNAEIMKLLPSTPTKLDAETKQFIDNCKMLRETGLILGLDVEIPMKKSPRDQANLSVPTTGQLREPSISLLSQLLREYKKTLNKETLEYFDKISKAFELEEARLKNNGDTDAKELLERYNNSETTQAITLIPNPHHPNITLSLYKKYLILSDHSQGVETPAPIDTPVTSKAGTPTSGEADIPSAPFEIAPSRIVYRIPEGFKITLDHITGETPFKTLYEEKNRILTLPPAKETSEQESVNLAFVNAKSSIEAMLCIMHTSKNRKQETDVSVEAQNYAKTEYEKFTRFIRKFELDNLISGFKRAADPNQKGIYLNLFVELLLTQQRQRRREARTEATAEEAQVKSSIDAALREDPNAREYVDAKLKERNNFSISNLNFGKKLEAAGKALGQGQLAVPRAPTPLPKGSPPLLPLGFSKGMAMRRGSFSLPPRISTPTSTPEPGARRLGSNVPQTAAPDGPKRSRPE